MKLQRQCSRVHRPRIRIGEGGYEGCGIIFWTECPIHLALRSKSQTPTASGTCSDQITQRLLYSDSVEHKDFDSSLFSFLNHLPRLH